MALIKLLMLPVTIALSLVHLALRLVTGLIGMLLGHVIVLAIIIGGIIWLMRG